MESMVVPQGTFELSRPYEPDSSPLRAWDAADTYLLEHLADVGGPEGEVLLANDAFGALGTALAARRPCAWSDSVLAHEATRQQLATNGLDEASVTAIASTDDPPGPFAVVLLKVPKSLALLEDQLVRVRPHLRDDALVIAAGMTKMVHKSTISLFERVLGPTPTSLAKRKARLLLPALAESASRSGANQALEAVTFETPWGSPAYALPNVFSRNRIDAGTDLLLRNLPTVADSRAVVVDVGCGSGLLGTGIAVENPHAEVCFLDVSYQAVASAEMTFRAACGPERRAVFRAADGFAGMDAATVDLVVCNPPFHAGNARGDHTAWRLLTGAHRVLRVGGEIRIVANRHLGHHTKLQKIFGNHEVEDANPKFVVLSAVKR